jgi:Uma2 family endonuclease
MRIHSADRTTTPVDSTQPLRNGDRLRQPEFHERYLKCPEDERWELVGGIVYMASPLGLTHSRFDGAIGLILELYQCSTPGVEVLHGVTTILGQESEPQPDLGLRILPEYHGRSKTLGDYVKGPPELLVEIAHSTRALDLHQKREDYEQTGVLEYLVVCTEERELYWFDFQTSRKLRPDGAGIYRSKAFPGLWIEGQALLNRDSARNMAVLQEGLASPAHASFVRRLERARRRST